MLTHVTSVFHFPTPENVRQSVVLQHRIQKNRKKRKKKIEIPISTGNYSPFPVKLFRVQINLKLSKNIFP